MKYYYNMNLKDTVEQIEAYIAKYYKNKNILVSNFNIGGDCSYGTNIEFDVRFTIVVDRNSNNES